MTITLTVAGRIATVEADGHAVAGNTYPVTLALDSEWTGDLYLRVRFGSLYYDIPFASSAASVDVQFPVGYPEVGIGVFSEALEICTNEARIRLLRSILEAGEQVVEFDSDLYEQWAGEVTTLLTDDAFDAESTRPVQNAVLTAWKDTVPLDANLVHKTGNESIAGEKTFTSQMKIEGSSIAGLKLICDKATSEHGWKQTIQFFDGAGSREQGYILGASGDGYNSLDVTIFNPDHSVRRGLGLRGYADYLLLTTSPRYPVDGSGNPQALGVNEVMASGNIAVDPRLVHTTGNEFIAGKKTFTSTILQTATNPRMVIQDTSTSNLANGIEMRSPYLSSNGARKYFEIATDMVAASGGGYASHALFGLLSPDGTRTSYLQMYANDTGGKSPRIYTPTYTADNNADEIVVNRTMLAMTPTVVHTTGNETVAGRKSFSENITGLCSLRTTDATTVGTAGQYKVVMRIEKAKLVGTRTHTLLYFVTRQRGRGFDLVSLYSNNTSILSFEMNLRSNQEGYTYILSEDSTYGYISIICKGDTGDTVQAGVLFSTEPSTRMGAFGSESTDTPRDTIPGTEIMRLTT